MRLPAHPPKLHPTRSPEALPAGLSVFTFTNGQGSITAIRARSWHEARSLAAVSLGAPIERVRLLRVNGKDVSE